MGADILEHITDSVICTDEYGRILLFNRAAERSFGYSASEAIGKRVEMLLPQRERVQHAHHVRGFASGDGAANRLMGHQREVCGRKKNGDEFATEATISRYTVDGRTILTVVHRDIADRKHLEEQREAISRELEHRIGNVFSVVSALVSLSAKGAASVGEFEHSLQGRLRAMNATQSFLQRRAQGVLSLSELLLAELAYYRSHDGTNLNIEIAPIGLCPAAIQPLALAFHELATNSAKYGAFSHPHGCVSVTSESISDGDRVLLALSWRETGGPPLKAPHRQGLGTSLIEQVITGMLRGTLAFEYRSEGMVCQMTLPQDEVEEKPRFHGADHVKVMATS